MALPNTRLRTPDDAFFYFVGARRGETVGLWSGELWLPEGVEAHDLRFATGDGEQILIDEFLPDLQELGQLSEGALADIGSMTALCNPPKSRHNSIFREIAL